MTNINGDVHHKEHDEPYDRAALTEPEPENPNPLEDRVFARRRTTQLATELAATERELDEERTLTRCLTSIVRDYEKELGRPLAPPPEIIDSMTYRCSRMRAIAMTAGDRELTVVAPPGGFDDPEETWRNITGHYRRDGN